jgi:hypothetical protein
MEIPQGLTVLVRHDRALGGAAPDFFAADDDRNVDGFIRHFLEAGLQLGACRRSGGVTQIGVVLGAWDVAAAGKDIMHWCASS